jgi:hypothetical protein
MFALWFAATSITIIKGRETIATTETDSPVRFGRVRSTHFSVRFNRKLFDEQVDETAGKKRTFCEIFCALDMT